VKAIVQYTAQAHDGYDMLTQGAGFLNARGAVELARYFADPSGGPSPSDPQWSKRLIWGNRLVSGGRLRADANAWATSVTWGEMTTADGEAVEWGSKDLSVTGETGDVVESAWSVADESANVVWGSTCGGGDCNASWSPQAVSGTSEEFTVVWGMDSGFHTVVWGMDSGGDDTVVWGMSCVDTLCEPVIWSDR
jgi:hypothetical protein